MRIMIQGFCTPTKLVSEFSDLLIDLAEMGVDELDGVNLYLRLRADNQIVELRTPIGGKIDVLVVGGPTVRGYAQDDPAAPGSFARPRAGHMQ